eukprot:2804854-Pleurochrysis_carterae.AAC.1
MAALASPRSSLPCATDGCPLRPCAHCASPSVRIPPPSPREWATVVYLRVGAPSAHCANVTRPAPALS